MTATQKTTQGRSRKAAATAQAEAFSAAAPTAASQARKARATKAASTRKAKAEAKAAPAAAPAEAWDWHATRAAKAAERGGKPAPERRNETRHPDGAAAVAWGPCPKCQALKGEQCFKANGQDRTPFVHAPRMEAWDNS